MEVHQDGLRRRFVDEVERFDTVASNSDDRHRRVVLHYRPQGLGEGSIVVHEDDPHRPLRSDLRSTHPGEGSEIESRIRTALLAILYDIHGNTEALDAVLAKAAAVGVDRYLLGGDYGTPSPAPRETLERLRALPNSTWIRGNTERWLREPPPEIPMVREAYAAFEGALNEPEIDWLYSLPERAELDGVLYVHGSPLADDDSFAPQAQPGEERLLVGVRDRTVVFGHSHQQFRRPGPSGTDLINPGSVGMPLDGDVRAAWATWDGDFEFRRTEYDVDRAAAAYRAMGGAFGEFAARRIERGSD